MDYKALDLLRDKRFPLIIGNKDQRNKILASHILSQCLTEEVDIVVVAPSFRDVKIIANRIISSIKHETIFEKYDNKVEHLIDRINIRIKNSIIRFLPCRDGSKINGMRPSILIIHEFDSMLEEILMNSMRAASSVSPECKIVLSATDNFNSDLLRTYIALYQQLMKDGYRCVPELSQHFNPLDYGIRYINEDH